MALTDPHSCTDLDQGEVVKLALDLQVDFEDQRLSGEALLELAEPGEGPLDLDTRGLEIEEVTAGGGRALRWSLAAEEGFMGSRLRIERPPRTSAIAIRYRTSPAATALQWLEPQHTSGGKHPYLFSQCQPIHARSLVPIQDSPRVRFAYEAALSVPLELSAVMSAAPGESSAGPTAGTRTFRFAMPQPIPAYLLALAVGDLAAKDLGPRSRVYAEPGVLEAAAWEFAGVDAMLQAAEELFGPYLWERFDFLVMPPAFPYGGMENPRLTFLTPTLLAGDRSLVNVLAHELAHSWTGNLVTNATMNDFWLNEGFTVWAERRILERIAGEEAVALASAIGGHALTQDLERFGADSPFTRLRTELEGVDPDEVYSIVPYEKGFLFLTRIEQEVGREAFEDFVKAYIQRFQFTSLSTAEFEAFFEAELPGVGAAVDAGAWIHAPGLPADCPAYRSARLDALEALAAGWDAGRRPDVAEASRWSAEEWQIFLQRLPRSLAAADCEWLERSFGLDTSSNAEILSQWLLIAARSSYEPAFARLRDFLSTVGRMKYLKPLYSALHGGEATRALAAELFAAYGERYHPIARAGLERLLAS